MVEHIHDTYGQRKLRALIEAYADGSDTETAIKKALGIDIDELQKGFDASLETRYAKLRRALKAPEELTPEMPLDKAKAVAAANPESFAAQMALGEALAPIESGCGDCGVREGRGADSERARRRQPARGDCGARAEEGRQGARGARARSADQLQPHRHRVGAPAGDAARCQGARRACRRR